MGIDCQNRILPLAKELWNILFNNPHLDGAPRVRDILRRNFDFEAAYHIVMRGPRLPADLFDGEAALAQERQALREALAETYEYIDEKVRTFSNRPDAPNAVNIYEVQQLIAKFAGNSQKPGFFFTLNQDLFVECQYYNGTRPTLPGIPHSPTWFTTNGSRSLAAERCVIPSSATNARVDGSPFLYVKLHGSSNWYTANEETMVIGHAKEDQIAARPILEEYLIFSAMCLRAHRGVCSASATISLIAMSMKP